MHNSCAGNDWYKLRDLVEPGYREQRHGVASENGGSGMRPHAEDCEATPKGSQARRVKLTPASSITPRPVRWTWEDTDGGRIPAGEITLTVGGGGIGKSTFHAWLVSRITRGELPGIHYGTPRSAIICATEDSWARTIVPRLMAAGADLDRVFRVEVEDAGEEDRLTLPVDLDLLAEVIKENEVALVSLDPLMTLVGAQLDTHKDHEVRRALEPLALVADDTDVAILGNGHFNKSLSGDPMSRITGSAAFGQVVRGVLAFAKDEEADLCVISQPRATSGALICQTWPIASRTPRSQHLKGRPQWADWLGVGSLIEAWRTCCGR
jgi:predicted ATP-dependent serine protease